MAAEENDTGVEIQHLTAQPVVSIRETIQVADLGAAMGDRIGALASFLAQTGAQIAGPPFVRYHTFGETETDMEFGVPVAEPIAGAGRVAAGELPGGPAISTQHIGPHERLGEAYTRLEAWLQERHRERNGATWEVYYWLDPSNPSAQSDPATWRTQLVQPIKE